MKLVYGLCFVSVFAMAEPVLAQSDLSPSQPRPRGGNSDVFSPNWAKPRNQGPNVPYRDPSSIRIDRRGCTPGATLDGRTGTCGARP